VLVVNRAPADLPPALRATIAGLGAPLAAVIPDDPAVGEFDTAGRPLVELPLESAASQAVEALAAMLVHPPQDACRQIPNELAVETGPAL
jgi:CO dehydrogenase nickel-insertion accessory protein CooC1